MRAGVSSAALLLVVLLCWCSSGTNGAQEDRNRLEASLLQAMGFARRPRPDRNRDIVVPPALLELYKKHAGKDLPSTTIRRPGISTKTANTVRSFIHQESDLDSKFGGYHRFRLHFDVSGIPDGESLKAAELALNREEVLDVGEGVSPYQQVLLYDILRPGVAGKRDLITTLIDSRSVDVRHSDRLSLDALPAVERWVKSPRSNHGLIVKVVPLEKGPKDSVAPAESPRTERFHHVRLRRSAGEEPSRWSAKQPLLLAYTDDGRSPRVSGEALLQRRLRRASAKKHRRKESHFNCRREPMYVDFEEVGWNDWIVAPSGYDAYLCRGDCPFPLSDHLNTTNHAIVQTLVNSVNPNAVPKACCVPTQLNSISMLYVDDDQKVVLKNYQDMAVLGCGCQ